MESLTLSAPKQQTISEKYKRPPFYPGYDYSKDYFDAEARAQIADFLESSGQENIAERYRICRQAKLLVKCKEENSSRCKEPGPGSGNDAGGYFLSQSSCRARFCEPCARSFGEQYRRKVKPFVKALGTGRRKYGFKHLTLTFKRSPDDPPISPEWVKSAMKKVAKFIRKFYHEKDSQGNFLTGALGVLEMSPDGFFHVHCLVYGRFYKWEELSRAWLKITGDSYIISINDAEGRSKYYKNMTPVQALNEVTKYIKKPVQTPFIEELFGYITAIKGRRRVITWGLFYNHPDLKPPHNKSYCPFCDGSVVLVAEYEPDNAHLINDGSYWPTWAVGEGLRAGALPKRYAGVGGLGI